MKDEVSLLRDKIRTVSWRENEKQNSSNQITLTGEGEKQK